VGDDSAADHVNQKVWASAMEAHTYRRGFFVLINLLIVEHHRHPAR
jgi:hypothetical protein